MKSFYAEVFIDDRPVHAGTIQTTQPRTAAARILKEAIAKKTVKHRPSKYVVRLTKLGNVNPE